MNLIALVSSTLKSLNIITIYGWYDENLKKTHITFLEFNNLDNEYADDKNTTEEHYITVDLWTFDVDESQQIKKQIKKLMKENDFLYQDGATQPQPQSDGSILYHVTTRWLIIEGIE